MKRDYPVTNELWKHFKGDIYKIDGLAIHSETGEPLVLYHVYESTDMSKIGIIYARPLELFMSLCDEKKYPQFINQYRFEKVGVDNS